MKGYKVFYCRDFRNKFKLCGIPVEKKKLDNNGFKIGTPTCTLPTYLHIFCKGELKPDHEIQKSLRYFKYHFLLLPQPFQFFTFFNCINYVS